MRNMKTRGSPFRALLALSLIVAGLGAIAGVSLAADLGTDTTSVEIPSAPGDHPAKQPLYSPAALASYGRAATKTGKRYRKTSSGSYQDRKENTFISVKDLAKLLGVKESTLKEAKAGDERGPNLGGGSGNAPKPTGRPARKPTKPGESARDKAYEALGRLTAKQGGLVDPISGIGATAAPAAARATDPIAEYKKGLAVQAANELAAHPLLAGGGSFQDLRTIITGGLKPAGLSAETLYAVKEFPGTVEAALREMRRPAAGADGGLSAQQESDIAAAYRPIHDRLAQYAVSQKTAAGGGKLSRGFEVTFTIGSIMDLVGALGQVPGIVQAFRHDWPASAEKALPAMGEIEQRRQLGQIEQRRELGELESAVSLNGVDGVDGLDPFEPRDAVTEDGKRVVYIQ